MSASRDYSRTVSAYSSQYDNMSKFMENYKTKEDREKRVDDKTRELKSGAYNMAVAKAQSAIGLSQEDAKTIMEQSAAAGMAGSSAVGIYRQFQKSRMPKSGSDETGAAAKTPPKGVKSADPEAETPDEVVPKGGDVEMTDIPSVEAPAAPAPPAPSANLSTLLEKEPLSSSIDEQGNFNKSVDFDGDTTIVPKGELAETGDVFDNTDLPGGIQQGNVRFSSRLGLKAQRTATEGAEGAEGSEGAEGAATTATTGAEGAATTATTAAEGTEGILGAVAPEIGEAGMGFLEASMAIMPEALPVAAAFAGIGYGISKLLGHEDSDAVKAAKDTVSSVFVAPTAHTLPKVPVNTIFNQSAEYTVPSYDSVTDIAPSITAW
jgi:hypothetical protein